MGSMPVLVWSFFRAPPGAMGKLTATPELCYEAAIMKLHCHPGTRRLSKDAVTLCVS